MHVCEIASLLSDSVQPYEACSPALSSVHGVL